VKARWIILIAIVALIVGGSIWGGYAKKHAPVPITVARTERKAFKREASGTGNIEAKVYSLSFTTPGRISRVLVRERDRVQAGAVLAELEQERERESLVAAQDRARALTASLRANDLKTNNDAGKLRASLAQARRQLKLSQRLRAIGAEAAETVREGQRLVNQLSVDLDSLLITAGSQRSDLQAQIAQAKADSERSTQALKDARLIAPVAGTIAQVDFRAGEAAQGMIKLVQAGTLRVKAQIQEVDTVRLAAGMPARIELDADPDHPLEAIIDELGVMATVKSEGGSATLPVKFRFTDPSAEGQARPGYTATATIVTQRIENALQIPLEALIEEKKDGIRQYKVWVVTPDPKTNPKAPKIIGTVRKQTVTVVARNLTSAVVDGLTLDTLVITLPPDTLAADKRVVFERVKDEKAP